VTAENAKRYQARLLQVLDYIDTHLHDDLDLNRLSCVAAFSTYHFHRQFRQLFGVSVMKYVQLRRLKRAAYQLAFRPDRPVLEIALDSAYEGPEAFARAFKRHVGQSPTDFRHHPQWRSWFDAYQPVHDLRGQHMQPTIARDQVSIVQFAETKIAAMEHRGDPAHIGDTIRKFVRWRKQQRLSPKVSKTFNIFYVDSEDVPPEQFRVDVCVSITADSIDHSDAGVVAKVIPAGRCAKLRHVGSDETLEAAIHFLYAQWLPQSGEELRDFPLFLERLTFFPDVPEHEAVVDIYLPLSCQQRTPNA
jgi:AraC family transcriptional regulator